MTYCLGIDFGTSGARVIAIDSDQHVAQVLAIPITKQTPKIWQQTLFQLLSELDQEIKTQLQVIAINGTSGTVLLCDDEGQPISEALLYKDDRGRSQLSEMQSFVPAGNIVQSATSSLAKLLWFDAEGLTSQAKYFLHQADWLGALLHDQYGISDYHNALKLGFDVMSSNYPDWLKEYPLFHLCPQVISPGQAIATILPSIGEKFQINPQCKIHAGTTDSIAAFIASGASQIGEAVTSLGSTLVLKLLSEQPVDDLSAGIYSHRFGKLWLTGGASNTGGAVLKHFFDGETLKQLSLEIDPLTTTNLDYYPLLQPGDRFPINDPTLQPRISPRPEGDRQFLKGLLEGIANIEKMGYNKLQQLGASKLVRVFTAGGGAKNPTWTKMRANILSCFVQKSLNPEAAFGTALLAQRGNLETWERNITEEIRSK